MPELPDVETARIQIEKAMKKRRIISIQARPDARVFDQVSAKEFSRKMTGATVTGSDRRGKYFWLKLNRKPWPVFHFGMTGYFEVHAKNELPIDAPRALRVEFRLSNGTRIWFIDPRRFGRIRLENDPLREGAVSRLGYDPLFFFPSAKKLHSIIVQHKTSIKTVLLDQSIFAGVGNWIADEVLFQSKISPLRSARSLSEKETTLIRSSILRIIKKAVSVSARTECFPRNWLFHYRWSKANKKNPPTYRGHQIRFSTVGGRTSAWVPDLQK